MSDRTAQRERLQITGQVQGVGFRPFVYRLAVELHLTGWVLNDARGVSVQVQGPADALRAFADRVGRELPPLAAISELERQTIEPMTGEQRFEIRPSDGGEMTDAQVTVDVATCDDCLRELNDPDDPRYRYPFINCTHCGPRYSIVRGVPYDRPNTSMAEFAMCPLCAGQYADPADRRFHAQPVACPACGPAVWLVDPRGKQIACDDPIEEARNRLRAGEILAVKGLGGFQLACRADDEHVVGRLRRRKHRDAKPFALMVGDLSAAAALCEISPEAEALLTGPIRPVVIMPRRVGALVSADVADGLDTLGVMLPYTPLHHLLLAGNMPPLVMTSGNPSDQPLVKDTDAALANLATLADAMLVHNRHIERRVDDSVVQIHTDGRAAVLRRARGYAPTPIRLEAAAEGGPVVLAVGAELKSSVCLLKGNRALLSEHIGDLKDGRVYRHFIDTINHLEDLFNVRPQLIAADLHPQYLSTQYAQRRHRGELAARDSLPIERIQHHHAHVVSCMAENGCAEPVIGLVCDGVGYGDDGTAWGGEILLADTRSYRRLGHLRHLPLVGGDIAATETFRPALAALADTFGDDGAAIRTAVSPLKVDTDRLLAAARQLDIDVNCVRSSSLGRWFDAVAFLTGIAGRNDYEGQAPMLLEAAAEHWVDESYPYRLVGDGPFEIDLRPMVLEIFEDIRARRTSGTMAAKFHNTVSNFLLASAVRAREATGLETVALSGGCFANRTLTARLREALELDGFAVLVHHSVPCNDGGVALGQVVIAAARAAGESAAQTESKDVSGHTTED